MEIKTFKDLEISENIQKAIIDMEFTEPTDVQKEVIPVMLSGKDIIAQAPTGTGKTCAFLIPIVNNVDKDSETVQVIIMCPTRELVLQTTEELKNVSKYTEKVRILAIYGGQNIERQLFGLRKRPQIIIGTPGRVIDHLDRKTLKLNDLKVLVLDEADEMLNMGFREDIDRILQNANTERQTVLFSATLPKEIIEISKNYQKEPVSIKTKLKENEIPDIEQYYTIVNEKEKIKALTTLLDDKKFNLSLIFTNTKKRAQELALILLDYGYVAEALHGDLRQSQRDLIMKRFRSNDIKILIATDVAARGIDVDDIEAIFNYDIPYDTEYYVHRIGRTARANKKGIAYSFITAGQATYIKDYEKYTKTPIVRIDVIKGKTELNIDDKKLKIAFSNLDTNLDKYKDHIKEKLDEFNLEKNTEFDYLDLIAALLRTDSEMPTLSEAGLRASKEKKTRSKGNPDATRLFINVGTRDKATDKSLKQYITASTDITESDIFEIKLLENFGFIEIQKDKVNSAMKLISQKFNNREINIEVAGDKTSKEGRSSRGGSSSKASDKREFRPRAKAKEQNSLYGEGVFKKTEKSEGYKSKKSYKTKDVDSEFKSSGISFIKDDLTYLEFQKDLKTNVGEKSYSQKPATKGNPSYKGDKRDFKFESSKDKRKTNDYRGKKAFSNAEFSAETFDYKKYPEKSKSISDGTRAPKRKSK